MERNFENRPQIVEIKIFQDIHQESCHSDIDILNFDTFLSTPDHVTNKEQEAHQMQFLKRDKNIEEKEEIDIDGTEKQSKIQKLRHIIAPDTRLSNYVFPNIIRQVKQCLMNSFQAENKSLYNLLVQIFKKLKINYQVWAFDAILLILIYLRDKTELLTLKKFSAVIDHISSTLSKYLAKFVSKPFTKQQLKYLNNQYMNCIRHLKIYDDAEHTFDSLTQKKGQSIKQEFFQSVLLSRRRQKLKFLESISLIEKELSSGLVNQIISKGSPGQKQPQMEKKEKEFIQVSED